MALLLSCASSAALCGADCEDGHSDIPQFFLTSVLKLCADFQWADLCCFLSSLPLAALSGRYPGTVTGDWWAWFLLLYFALHQPLLGRQHQSNHMAWMRGTLPSSVVAIAGHLLSTRPFLGTGFVFFLPDLL